MDLPSAQTSTIGTATAASQEQVMLFYHILIFNMCSAYLKSQMSPIQYRVVYTIYLITSILKTEVAHTGTSML